MYILSPEQDLYLHDRARMYANKLRPTLERSQSHTMTDNSFKEYIDEIIYKVEWGAYRSAAHAFEEIGVWDTVPLNNIMKRVSKELILEYLK